MNRVQEQEEDKYIVQPSSSPSTNIISTPFTINHNETSIIAKLTQKFIIFNPLAQMNSLAQKSFQLTSELSYRITSIENNSLQTSLWFLEIRLKQLKIKLSSTENSHLAVWSDFLRKKINKFGLWDDYKPNRRISKSQASTIYQVTRLTDGKRFAVKAFAKGMFQQSPSLLEGLKQQIRLLRQVGQLNHDNLLGLEEVYQSDSAIYVVMKICGRDLIRGLNHFLEPEESCVKEVMKQLLTGLAALHQKNIVHRDIKPNNIMFKSMNKLELVISDFGLSTHLSEYHPFVRCGTPGFIAPEIFELKQHQAMASYACDIFSLGVVFHLLLTKQPLFSGNTSKEVFINNSKMKFDLNNQKYHNLSQNSLNLLKKMLAVDQSQRITAKHALMHQYFANEQIKIRSPAPTFQTIKNLMIGNEEQISQIDLQAVGRKRLKSQQRKHSQL